MQAGPANQSASFEVQDFEQALKIYSLFWSKYLAKYINLSSSQI